jgi:hypothetical protein
MVNKATGRAGQPERISLKGAQWPRESCCPASGGCGWVCGQRDDGRRFLWPASAWRGAVEWQPAAAALVVGEASGDAGLDRAPPAGLAQFLPVASGERGVHDELLSRDGRPGVVVFGPSVGRYRPRRPQARPTPTGQPPTSMSTSAAGDGQSDRQWRPGSALLSVTASRPRAQLARWSHGDGP